MKKDEVIIRISETSGLEWPYYNNEKAYSASTLTKILKEIEYQEKQIPEFILLKAANNGKIFHQAIQDYIESGQEYNCFENKVSRSLASKITETISFFKEKNFQDFIGSEILHHRFYEDDLIATYVDLEFKDFVIEMKTNNPVMIESPILMLIFEIQMFIQHYCSQKEIFLLWSTGSGITFRKFVTNQELGQIVKVLIGVISNKEIHSLEDKKSISEKILKIYSERKKLVS